MKRRLFIIISAPVLLAALISSGFIYFFDLRSATLRIEREALDYSNGAITHLQNMLNTQLLSGNKEDARLSLSVSALRTGMNALILSDEQDRVMLASRYIWEGELATVWEHYDVALSKKVRLFPQPIVNFSAQRNRLYGYYPVTIKIAEKELGIRKFGVLFFEYDIETKLKQAKHEAATSSAMVGLLLVLSAILVSLLLHNLVSTRIARLVNATQKFAKGELNVRARLNGSDEIAYLGQSFDLMAEEREKVELTLANDITEIKHAQQALEQLNNELEVRVAVRTQALQLAKEEAESASRSKSLFLTSMSHELRTPLNAILGYAQLMQITPGLAEDVLLNANEIRRAGNQLLALMNDILDLARIESGRLDIQIEVVSLSDLLSECCTQAKPAAESRGIQFRHDEGCMQYSVKADRRRLIQIMNNLISNAIKYNRESGIVSLSCDLADSGQVRIKVADTGLGIAADRLDQLFQSFNRLGAEMSTIEGTGIGLAITRRLIEGMGGKVGVNSQCGTGSTFWVELPIAS